MTDDPDEVDQAAGPEQIATTASSPSDEQEQSVATTASRGFMWANVGVFTRYASALVMAAALARVLDTTDYAVMVTLMVVTYYFDSSLDMGMGAALVYEQEKGITERVQVAFTVNFGVTAVLATVALVGSPLIAKFFDLPGYTNVFRCLAIVVALSGMTTIPWSLFMRAMDFRKRAIVEVARDLTRFVVTMGLAFGGFGAWSVIIGMICAYAVWMVLTWAFIHFRPVLHWDRKIAGELFAFAWRMAGTRFLGVLSLNGDYVIIGNRRPDQYPLYYQAFRLPEFVMGAQLNAMSAVLFPMYARIRSEGQMAMSAALYKALRMVALFSIPVGVGLALVARDAMAVMYGTDADVAIRTMEILSVTGCIVGLGFATGDLLYAIGRPGLMVRINGVMVPVMLTAMWFVAEHGIVWVATVHLVVAAFFTLVRQIVVNRIVAAESRAIVGAVVPALVVSGCILALGLPTRLATPGGFMSMIAIVAAGSLGGAIGLLLSRSARDEVLGMIARLRS